MQNPSTGLIEPVPDDDLENVPRGWPIYKIGDSIVFNGWYWKVTGFTDDGGLSLKADKKIRKLGRKRKKR